MTFFKNLRSIKSETDPFEQKIQKILDDEEIPQDPSLIKEIYSMIPKIREYRCTRSSCPSILAIEVEYTVCPTCGKPVVLAQDGLSSIIVNNEIKDEIAGIAHYLYALKRYKTNDVYGAIESFTKTIQLKPNFVDAFHNRSEARIAIEDFQGAIEDASQVIILQPNASDAYLNRGSAKASLGDYETALNDFDKSLELGFHKPIVHFNKGLCLIFMKKLDEAKTVLEHYCQLVPSNDSRALQAKSMIKMFCV